MKKPVKYIFIAFVLAISVYNSIYFEKLDKIKSEKNNSMFDAKAYASTFIKTKAETLPSLNASNFLIDIQKNTKTYAESHGNKLGISTDYYFIINGNAHVLKIEDEDVIIALNQNPSQKLKIATDFIFGNAIREGAKMANIGDYQNTMDYNNISVELNNMVREKIIPPFIKNIKEGNSLYFKGAVKVNTKQPKLDTLRVIPIILKID